MRSTASRGAKIGCAAENRFISDRDPALIEIEPLGAALLSLPREYDRNLWGKRRTSKEVLADRLTPLSGRDCMTRLNHDSTLRGPIDAREAEISKIAESKEEVAELFKHLRQIIEGRSFRGSHRSGQFLIYIVEQAIAGRFTGLKERIIGIELFGRSPSYDTGEDAIVRVTASDVRKRLLQHYGENGRSAKFYIGLPSGSYIPEITRASQPKPDPQALSRGVEKPLPAPDHAPGEDAAATVTAPEADSAPDPVASEVHANIPDRANTAWKLWLFALVMILVCNGAFWALVWRHPERIDPPNVAVLPWSAILNSSHATHLITSDPNIVFVQEITGNEISASDYANRKYIPEHNSLTPEDLRLSHVFLWGDHSAAAVDTPIALRIAALVQNGSRKIDAHAARSVQLSDLKNDDNFILLGSPRSNPWSTLFTDEMDFRFVFDKTTRQEIIQNVHPRNGELPAYVPTAAGWATGQSYAIVAFLRNPDQDGQVLLLAGANAEGTEAAGKFVTDLSRLSASLDQCGIRTARPIQHFEILLGWHPHRKAYSTFRNTSGLEDDGWFAQ